MVLVKMLKQIDPLPMRVSTVMTMVTISPSRRDVSLVEQLRWSPRLVPPRFCLEMAALRPDSFLMIFPGQKKPYTRRWASGGFQVAHGAGRRAPHPRGRWVAPSGTSFAQYFVYIMKCAPVKFQDFWSCAE